MKKVLYIEDDEDDRLIFKEVFESMALNLELRMEKNGEAARRYLDGITNKADIALIIVDNRLDGLSSKGIVEYIQQLEDCNNTTLVIFSVAVSPTDEQYFNMRHIDVFTKPSLIHEYYNCIELMLKNVKGFLLAELVLHFVC